MLRHGTRGQKPTRTLASVRRSSNVPLNRLHLKWLDIWKDSFSNGSLHPTKPQAKKPFYCLSMFPYPSGILHLGHQRVYTISDVVARYKRLQGFDVMHPMGWDAFGLPAENAAIERGISPKIWTEQNISKMKEQMKLMLADFDWEKEVDTTSPAYYKWTQKIFTLLFEKGLAYRKGAEINWDPVDQTVLANEQVDANGFSWRSGAQVEKKVLEQWFIGITKYADELNNDLKDLSGWPEKVKTMQKNWIGKSNGAEIRFPTNGESEVIVYTSRPDTLFSVQFLALALDHPLVIQAAKSDPELEEFLKRSSEQEDLLTKNGFELKDIMATIPISVDGKKINNYNIPIFAASYVLGSYGHGAVMGCPAHDERDFEFWSLHRPGVPTRPTVGKISDKIAANQVEVFSEKNGRLYDASVLTNGVPTLGIFDGLTTLDAMAKITAALMKVERGNSSTQFKLRDWLISRQRYWGAPIPIIHCESCGPVAVPDKDLPVLLPDVTGKHFGKGNPLGTIEAFVNTSCPSCGKAAKRDTDTMDTFIDSSWYFFRYTDSKNDKTLFDYDKVNKYFPVDLYIGGVEHAILHLLYSRFISKFLGDCGLWDGKNSNNEPIRRLITQGMVQGKTYIAPSSGNYLRPPEIQLNESGHAIVKATGEKALLRYEKMSKSKYNGVDPADLIEKHGPDAVRAQILFFAPVSDALNWNDTQIQGIERWLKKVINMGNDVIDSIKREQLSQDDLNSVETIILNDKANLNEEEVNLLNEVQLYIRRIAETVDSVVSMNTLISDFMKLTNYLQQIIKKTGGIRPELIIDSYKKLLILISPVTPSVAEECWEKLCYAINQPWQSILWQEYPKSYPIINAESSYGIMLNGKKICTIKENNNFVDKPHELIIKELRKQSPIVEHLADRKIKKLIAKKGVISIICD